MLTRRQLIATGMGLAFGSATREVAAQEAPQLKINSTRYIATNADTGAIFAQRDARERVAIASLTKIFTAVEALSIAPLDYEITTTEDDLQSTDATIMGFGPGMTYTLEELIYGMMLPSGNDAAHAISRSLGYESGDSAEEATQRFMDKVNQRVLNMGLEDTHLLNPDGWGVPGHYSTAADVAAFMAYASQNEFLLKVMGTRTYRTERGSNLTNTNKALWNAPSVLGGKTGYDWDSGWCLVQIAQREDTRIIAVTLDGIAPDDWYNDNLVLLDYGFSQQKAIGNKEYPGEHVVWQNPDPALFAQAGSGEASITGESIGGKKIVTREETEQVAKPEHTEKPQRMEQPVSVPRSSSLLAGLGATALAGGMAAAQWTAAGGDRTAATVVPSLRAAGVVARRMLPTVPSLTIGKKDIAEEQFDHAQDDEHLLTEEHYDIPDLPDEVVSDEEPQTDDAPHDTDPTVADLPQPDDTTDTVDETDPA